MNFQFEFKRVYGKPKFYPMNSEAIVVVRYGDPSKKCLSSIEFKNLLRLRALGAEFEVSKEDGPTTRRIVSVRELVEILKEVM